jgi:hypothetical protein
MRNRHRRCDVCRFRSRRSVGVMRSDFVLDRCSAPYRPTHPRHPEWNCDAYRRPARRSPLVAVAGSSRRLGDRPCKAADERAVPAGLHGEDQPACSLPAEHLPPCRASRQTFERFAAKTWLTSEDCNWKIRCRRAVPLLGGLCGKGTRDFSSVPDGVARVFRH